MTPPADDLPVPPPMTRHGQIEIDTFCTGCHYNLHGQPVSIDDRLGFPVCRCPECGRFHPAGTGVTASSVWLRRWATVLLFVWVGCVLVITLATLFAMAGASASSIGIYEHGEWVTANGTPIGSGLQYNTTNPTVFYAHNHYIQLLWPWFGGSNPNSPPLALILIISGISLGLGLWIGSLFVTVLWHWPRRRYLWCVLLIVPPAAFLMRIFHEDSSISYGDVWMQCVQRIWIQAGIQALGILLGVRFGRTFSRTLCRMIIPPKPRQALAFLWSVDNKPLPEDMRAR